VRGREAKQMMAEPSADNASVVAATRGHSFTDMAYGDLTDKVCLGVATCGMSGGKWGQLRTGGKERTRLRSGQACQDQRCGSESVCDGHIPHVRLLVVRLAVAQLRGEVAKVLSHEEGVRNKEGNEGPGTARQKRREKSRT
jgi:hypothetical protein